MWKLGKTKKEIKISHDPSTQREVKWTFWHPHSAALCAGPTVSQWGEMQVLTSHITLQCFFSLLFSMPTSQEHLYQALLPVDWIMKTAGILLMLPQVCTLRFWWFPPSPPLPFPFENYNYNQGEKMKNTKPLIVLNLVVSYGSDSIPYNCVMLGRLLPLWNLLDTLIVI